MTLDEYFQQAQELDREFNAKKKQMNEKHSQAVKEQEAKLKEEKAKLYQQVTDSPVGDIVEFTQLNGDTYMGVITDVVMAGTSKAYDYIPISLQERIAYETALKKMDKIGHVELPDELIKKLI